MAEEKEDTVVVVGCGLAGCMITMLLAKRGFKVEIFESKKDWRQDKKLRGGDDLHRDNIKRSINLALSHRGRCALRRLGLEKEVLKFGVPMKGRAIHTGTDSPQANAFQPYDEVDSSNCIYSVSREHLNNMLIAQMEANPNVRVRFGLKLTHVDRNGFAHFDPESSGSSMNTYNDYKQGSVRIKPRLIIGADGAYSIVRESLLRLLPVNFQRRYITHGYKELTIPPTKDGKFALTDYKALHIWPRGSFMMIALPNPDKTFTCTIFAPLRSEAGVPGLAEVRTPAAAEKYMKSYFPDVLPLMPGYADEFLSNPTSPLVTVKVSPWNYKDRVVLLGDAAHAMVPFYGQGMNSAFEDCLYLDEVIDKFGGNLAKAVPYFAKTREAAGNGIAQLSMRNYTEMRDHTGSTMFLLRKKFEGFLNRVFPQWWIPLYKMVTFTRIPYDTVIEREARQDGMLKNMAAAATFFIAAGGTWAAKAFLKSNL